MYCVIWGHQKQQTKQFLIVGQGKCMNNLLGLRDPECPDFSGLYSNHWVHIHTWMISVLFPDLKFTVLKWVNLYIVAQTSIWNCVLCSTLKLQFPKSILIFMCLLLRQQTKYLATWKHKNIGLFPPAKHSFSSTILKWFPNTESMSFFTVSDTSQVTACLDHGSLILHAMTVVLGCI